MKTCTAKVGRTPLAHLGESGTNGYKSYKNEATELVNPPLPQIRIPEDPCQGITVTDAEAEGISKCSVSSQPAC